MGPVTLGRGALEASAIAAWLLAEGATSHELLARGLTLALENADATRRISKALGNQVAEGGEDHYKEKDGEIKNYASWFASRFGYEISLRDRYVGSPRPGFRKLVGIALGSSAESGEALHTSLTMTAHAFPTGLLGGFVEVHERPSGAGPQIGTTPKLLEEVTPYVVGYIRLAHANALGALGRINGWERGLVTHWRDGISQELAKANDAIA